MGVGFSPTRMSYANVYDLDMLPDVRFWVDDTHIRLVSTSIHKGPVVHLEEGIAGIILPTIYVILRSVLYLLHSQVNVVLSLHFWQMVSQTTGHPSLRVNISMTFA